MGVLFSKPDEEPLFAPFALGPARLQHRVVLAPLTRHRADAQHVHTDLGVEYYAQRARVPGTLLITEATFIAPQAGGYDTCPGIYTAAQIAAWKKIVDAVHAEGSTIFLQLWALGRAADADVLAREGPYDVVGASAKAIPDRPGRPVPRALEVAEIQEYVGWYAQAAKNAVEGAGFDGVEIHAANGYLLDQFLQTTSNERTDAYGGTPANRIRFLSEVLSAVSAAIGAARTAVRISPWSTFQGMRMPSPKDTFSVLATHLAAHHGGLAYLHAVEPRVSGNADKPAPPGESNDFLREVWAPRPFISAGGYKRKDALLAARNGNELVAFGRHFISNPDLPRRLKEDVPLAPYDRSTFYTNGPEGYIDYPFYDFEDDKASARGGVWARLLDSVVRLMGREHRANALAARFDADVDEKARLLESEKDGYGTV